MGRLLADYVYRRGWVLLVGIVWFYVVGLGVVMSAIMELDKVIKTYDFIWMLFLPGFLAGARTFSTDLRRGYGRVIRTLPVSARQLAGASWVVSVVLLPVIAALALTGAILTFRVTDPSTPWPVSLGSAPLALLLGIGPAGTWYLLNVLTNMDSKKDTWREALRQLYTVGLVVLLIIMLARGPRFYNGWVDHEGGELLILALGLCAATVSLVISPYLLNRRILGRLHAGAGREAKSARVPQLFPSRGLSVAAPWLRPFAFCLACTLVAVLFLAPSPASAPSERTWYSGSLMLGLLSLYMFAGLHVFGRQMASLRVFRSLPLSSTRLATCLLGFPAMPYAACCLIVLPLLIILWKEGFPVFVALLALSCGLVSLGCGLLFRFGAPSTALLIVGGFILFIVVPFLIWNFRPVSPGIVDFFLDTIFTFQTALLFGSLLIVLGYLLIRQGIAASSRPYRSAPLSSEGER